MDHQHINKQRQQIYSELSLFLKRVRQREQDHYRLCEYTSKIIAKRGQPQQSAVINEQIIKSRVVLKQRLSIDISHQEQDFALATKCECFTFEEEDNLLTRRVAARVIEVTYNAIQLRRQLNDYYSRLYAKFKQNCLKKLGQLNANPAWIIRVTNRYLTQKVQIQLQRLRLSINLFYLNDHQSLVQMKNKYYQDLKKKQMLTTFNQRPESFNFFQRLIKRERNDNPEKEKQMKNQIQLRSKAFSSKQQQKLGLKIKKMEAKKLKKLAAWLSQVMDVCGQQLIQKLAPQNKFWETKRMMIQLLNRNKNNQAYINIFREKQPIFKEKILKSPPTFTTSKVFRCQSLEQQLLESNHIQDHHISSGFTTKQIRISQPMLNKKDISNQNRYDKKEISRFVPKSGYIKQKFSRQRVTVNNIPESEKLMKEKQVFSSQKQILSQQQFVQATFKTAILPKARFPQINYRVVSVDKVQSIKKQQAIKTKIEMKTTGTNFFQQIEKKISKFCQMKRNVLV